MSGRGVTVMLVHGAWHGSWCWESVRRILDAEGFTTAVVDNPSVTTPGSDLAADVDHLGVALDAIDGPVVLVGHSYAGAVISGAGMHPNVERLVYVSAFALDSGESVMQNELRGGEDSKLGDALVFDRDTVSVDPTRVVEFFFHDCTPAVAASAAAALRPMSVGALAGVASSAAWRHKPALYVVCTDDRAASVALQRSSAARATAVVEMPTSHSPFLSRPRDLAQLVGEYAVSRNG